MRCQDEGLFFLSSSSIGVWNQHGQNREDREEKHENLKIMSKETQNWHVKRKKKKKNWLSKYCENTTKDTTLSVVDRRR